MQNRGDTVYLNDLDDRQSSRAAEIERLEKLARMLDASVRVPFTNFRVGADSIVGLIPGIGDLTTSFFSSWILYQAWQMGVSKGAMAKMLGNVGIDLLVGAIPVAGDLFDAAYKANLRNLTILKKELTDNKTSRSRRV